MSEAKMKVDTTAGFAAPPFHPILTDSGCGLISDDVDWLDRIECMAIVIGG